jgi:hypothetical protein
MFDVERQLIVRQRMQERQREAETERLARMAGQKPVQRPDVRPWRARIAIAIVRRLARVAQTS